jgi:hypothetical protein
MKYASNLQSYYEVGKKNIWSSIENIIGEISELGIKSLVCCFVILSNNHQLL